MKKTLLTFIILGCMGCEAFGQYVPAAAYVIPFLNIADSGFCATPPQFDNSAKVVNTAWVNNFVSSKFPAVTDLHAAQLATTGVTHVWQCNDPVGSSTISDSKGNVPMSFGTSVLGNAGLLSNNKTGVQILLTGGGLSVPAATLPATGPYSIEFIAAAYAAGGTQIMCNLGSTDANRFNIYVNNAFDLTISNLRGDNNTGHKLSTGVNYFIIVCNGVDNVTVYQNGISIYSGGVPQTDGSILFGRFVVSNILQLAMRIQDIATYNIALTPTQINAHLIAAKL